MKPNLQSYIAGTGLEEFEHLKTDEAEQVVSDKLIDAGEITEVKHLDTAGDIEGKVEEIKTLTEVEASLEAYIDILKSADQGISRDAAAVLSVGLQRISNVLGPVEIPSTESFGGTMSRREATRVSLEALDEHLKTVGGKLTEMAHQLIEMIMQVAGELMHDVEGLVAKVQDLKDKAHGLKGEQVTVPIANAAVLSTGDEFQGHDGDAVLITVGFMDHTWLPCLRKMLELAAGGGEDLRQRLEQASQNAGFKDMESLTCPGGLSFQPMSQTSLVALPDPVFAKPENKAIEVTVKPEELYSRAQDILRSLNVYSKVCLDYKGLSSSLRKLRTSNALDQAKSVVGSEGSNTKLIQAILTSAGDDFTQVSKHIYKTLQAYAGVLAYEINAVQAAVNGNRTAA